MSLTFHQQVLKNVGDEDGCILLLMLPMCCLRYALRKRYRKKTGVFGWILSLLDGWLVNDLTALWQDCQKQFAEKQEEPQQTFSNKVQKTRRIFLAAPERNLYRAG